MKRWELVGDATAPDGKRMCLMRRDTELEILVDGKVLMSNRMHGSEEALAIAASRHLKMTEAPHGGPQYDAGRGRGIGDDPVAVRINPVFA